MRTLEDRLNQASSDARNSVAQVEVRPVSVLNRRIQQRRAFVGVAAFVLVAGVFGGTALLAGSDTGLSAASQGSPAQDETAIGGSADTTTAVALDDGPSPEMTDLREWDIRRFGEEAHFSIQILADDPGEVAGTGYERGLAAVAATEKPLGFVNLDGGWTAEAFTFTDQTTGYTGYYFLWQYSDTVALEVVVYVDLFEEATVVVSSIEKFAESDWADILDAIGDATPGVVASTTTPVGTPEERYVFGMRGLAADIDEITWVDDADDGDLIAFGNDFCEALDDGTTFPDLVAVVDKNDMTDSDLYLSLNGLLDAVVTICPRHRGALDEYIETSGPDR